MPSPQLELTPDGPERHMDAAKALQRAEDLASADDRLAGCQQRLATARRAHTECIGHLVHSRLSARIVLAAEHALAPLPADEADCADSLFCIPRCAAPSPVSAASCVTEAACAHAFGCLGGVGAPSALSVYMLTVSVHEAVQRRAAAAAEMVAAADIIGAGPVATRTFQGETAAYRAHCSEPPPLLYAPAPSTSTDSSGFRDVQNAICLHFSQCLPCACLE